MVGAGAVGAFALTGDDGTSKVAPDAADAAAAAPAIDPKVLEEQRRSLAKDRASREAREAPAKGPRLMPRGTPIPTKKPKKDSDGGGVPTEGNPVPAGVAQAYAKSIMDDPSTQFGCLQKLWNKESHWNYKASNPSSGAYGIPQALPGSKMASAGADWKTNYKTQIKWGLGYIDDRYGTPCKAWQHSQSVGWY
ncbi:lytic transglycosylase domain-containing protein [Spirillospora sp. NPDC029432]|uniref:aggregation-promoting factor C-terminal-like domain-containing protein n=1 Tax=Spirillospora sp. NPDC029432 TaxID=3154599 RepID=UPI003453E5A2